MTKTTVYQDQDKTKTLRGRDRDKTKTEAGRDRVKTKASPVSHTAWHTYDKMLNMQTIGTPQIDL